MTNVLIIDDEREVCTFFLHLLEGKGYRVKLGWNGKDFFTLIQQYSFDLALIDVKLPDTNGLELLKQLKAVQPLCKAIIMTGYSTVKTAVEAIKYGASDYIEKPFDDIDQLEKTIEELLDSEIHSSQHDMYKLAEALGFIIGTNKEMNDLIKLAYKIAKKNVNVLIEGETGTGKEVLAHFIHQASMRYDQPFIGINCGALSETLLESELFGHEKGAFTGALKEKKGIFEIANRGTLFLDEIGEASLATQVKLLRVLETGEYIRVGGETVRKTNTRIIAASHVNLSQAVKEKTFREDLLYRLDVVKLTLPPLRERIDDLPVLIEHFLKKLNSTLTFSDDAILLMKQYQWPGNVRELFNVVKRAVTLAEGETMVITPDYLPEKIKTNMLSIPLDETKNTKDMDLESYLQNWTGHILSLWKEGNQRLDLKHVLDAVKDLEMQIGRFFVWKTLKETLGDKKEAAERLNITVRQLRYLLKEKGAASKE
ncbi:sigma-54-dependent transcriptional regulator [Saccharococcus caldoxylosilyticus]|uniref:sigma-54-dependent transcriptional regulator n=1 Tax=Saccharococcus caldoxylosilyticus TaxID=81408 RepID=UPI001FCA4A81|nr:sigma-54 dependent transcriptional regulator [Parageobacillus caldoxylosilyticus]BDG37722.1 sigma-54-dependent Fis family transcriptional regulator [Parageobacillus caldoxylosilyticus]BDG41514.1 sigma-54-dependent Fis family transcriptional regulator [Parageobacillus caldoxylosilyticus]